MTFNTSTIFPQTRLRRTRLNQNIRDMVSETNISTKDLVWPIFIREESITSEIKGFFDVKRYSINELDIVCKEALDLGIPALGLFPYTHESERTENGENAINPDNLLCRSIRYIKSKYPELILIADVALDPFTSHGHDGIIINDYVDNDKTIEVLKKQSLNYAMSGVDIVAPSDMMDGRIGIIRDTLEKNGFKNTIIMSYSAKYASSFYGPFRNAVGAPKLPKSLEDKSSYQMDFRNTKEAITEALQDINEGADIIMVKPGLPYLDIIEKITRSLNIPVATYQVSGEYSMIKAASQQGLINEEKAVMESIISLKRAGARMIFTYFAPLVAKILK